MSDSGNPRIASCWRSMSQGVSPTLWPRLPSSTIVLPDRCDACADGADVAVTTSAATSNAPTSEYSVQRLMVHLQRGIVAVQRAAHTTPRLAALALPAAPFPYPGTTALPAQAPVMPLHAHDTLLVRVEGA